MSLYMVCRTDRITFCHNKQYLKQIGSGYAQNEKQKIEQNSSNIQGAVVVRITW